MKLLLVLLSIFVMSCASIDYHIRASYEMKNGTKFMCDVKGHDKVLNESMCAWKTVYKDTLYTCSVSVDKLQKGYQPTIDLDCELEVE